MDVYSQGKEGGGGFLDGRPERRDMQKFGKTSEEFCRSGHVVSAELVIQPPLIKSGSHSKWHRCCGIAGFTQARA